MSIKDNLKLPIHFRFPQFTRYFTLLIAVSAMVYAVYFFLTQIDADSSVFRKVAPFLVIFFAYDSIYRNLFTLNKISLTDKYLQFSYLAKKNVCIRWENMVRLESSISKIKQFVLHYNDGGEVKQHKFPMAFNNIIDVLSIIKILAPNIETDEFVASLVFEIKEKNDTNI